MSTTAQITANRANAQLSTGPTSISGSAISSQNATKHGLTGKTVHLTASEEQPYREFREGLISAHAPKGVEEQYLLDSLIDNRWRIAQISKIEAGLYALGEIDYAEKFPTIDLIRAYTFRQNQKEFDKLNRYQARLQRQANLELKQLTELQSTRKAQELKDFQDAAALYVRSLNTTEEFNPAEFGFVWSLEELFQSVGDAKQRFDAQNNFPTRNFLAHSDIPQAA